MTDAERLLESLQLRGSEGVHSHDIRRWGISGNPSQRVRELRAKGFEIEATRENRGKRPGVRYRLIASQPEPAQDLASEGQQLNWSPYLHRKETKQTASAFDPYSDWA